MTERNTEDRTYDEMQSISLTSQHRSQEHFDNLNQLSVQALQNAIETANMVGKNALDSSNVTNKQTIAHRDLAMDRTWNTQHDQSTDFQEKTFQDAVRAELIIALKDIGVTE